MGMAGKQSFKVLHVCYEVNEPKLLNELKLLLQLISLLFVIFPLG